jgi:Cys-tRNA(Pro)/Cys-tRNA(Cys) deacylase
MAAKTPALVALSKAGVAHTAHDFDHDGGDRNYGKAAAAALGVDESRVFKTLLVVADGRPAVGIVPVAGQLSLKGIAAALGAKKAEMCDPAAAQRLTGYVVGGISPFGQRKRLPTVLDESAAAFATIFVSGGRRGLDVELAPADLIRVLDATVAPIAAP